MVAALDALADVPPSTDREAVREEYLRRVIPEFTGHQVEDIVWTTAHGDLHYSNVTRGPHILDWEGWGSAPYGYDAATLYLYALLTPATAARIRTALATALNNLSAHLGERGRGEEDGLAASQEATQIRRALADANPEAYLPDLARSLINQSNWLREVGRMEEGLATIQETVGHYQALVDTGSDAYLSNLAWALHNLSIWLGQMGRREEGLAAVQEATRIFHALAETDPMAVKAGLQRSLRVATWLEGLSR